MIRVAMVLIGLGFVFYGFFIKNEVPGFWILGLLIAFLGILIQEMIDV